jgi:bifunctional non-homologous end joining protein LigD
VLTTQSSVAGEPRRPLPPTLGFPSRCRQLLAAGALERPVPWPMSPKLASRTDRPPRGEGWLHEMSLGGVRMLVRVDGQRTRLVTGTGEDWSERLAFLAPHLARLSATQLLLDGELVASSPDGTHSASALELALASDPSSLELHLFDLLALDDFDLRVVPLIRRKQLLSTLIPDVASGPLRCVHYGVGRGCEVLEASCAFGAQGIVSKRLDSPYSSGTGEDWLETRCQGRETFVIGGFVTGEGEALAALLVGERVGGELRYTGQVSTGFTDKTREQVQQTLARRVRARAPFAAAPALPHPERVVWVEPELTAEVAFAERTGQGELRFASFLELGEVAG